jgi:hypothetical protein
VPVCVNYKELIGGMQRYFYGVSYPCRCPLLDLMVGLTPLHVCTYISTNIGIIFSNLMPFFSIKGVPVLPFLVLLPIIANAYHVI